MIKYLTVGVNPPPLDTKILVKKSEFAFDDNAKVMTLSSNNWSQETAVEFLEGHKLTLWAIV